MERCWKGKGVVGAVEGGDGVWLAGTTRMSHSSSSLNLELQTYSGLRWHVYVCGCVHRCMHTNVHTWSSPIAKVTRFVLLALPRSVCVRVCVLEENESSLVTKPQHRSQILNRYLSFLSLHCTKFPSVTPPPVCKWLQLHCGLHRSLHIYVL